MLQDLKALSLLVNLANQRIQMKGRGRSNKTHVVEYNGQWLEMDEHEYRTYRHQKRWQERNDGVIYPPDTIQ
jgi:hypothetical protein